MPDSMRVTKRDRTLEDISFDKVLRRIRTLCNGLVGVDADDIAVKVCARIYDGVHTSELDELAAQLCATMVTKHPDYGELAARLVTSNHHKNTLGTFSETMRVLYHATDVHGKVNPLISDSVWEMVVAEGGAIDAAIDYGRDYLIDFFGFKTLERSYLLAVDGKIIERPQHMWMRVALGIHGRDLAAALETYDLMSRKFFTHATPTLFNAGTPLGSLASCFLLGTNDSVAGMYKTIGDCAMISKYAGGIGVHFSNIRGRGSHIRGTNGTSSGIVPLLRVYNATARHINQAGKRLGSIAAYLEPWHCDVEAFLEIRKNQGAEEERCRDLFTALWVNDRFMRAVRDDEDWYLMCPDQCPGLQDVYGERFDELYDGYVAAGRYRKRVRAQSVWLAILRSQIETGTPYMCYKDAANKKSNQKNIGTIKSSNLCSEIIEYSDEHETAVCNLASIALPSFVREGGVEGGKFVDLQELHRITGIITRNLNKVIDVTMYSTPEAERSNRRHRPIGIGVQGLADVYAMLRMPFESDEAAALNRAIFETIYHGAVEASMLLAKERAEALERGGEVALTQEEAALTKRRGAYATFAGSPASHGLLQFDLWDVEPVGNWDWVGLKAGVVEFGMRNSLLLAPMPTASTSQILGNTECFEPITSNIFQRQTLAGEFTVINKHLVRDLLELGLWSSEMKNKILAAGGSIQQIVEIPEHVRVLYKTVWEIKQKALIDQAADRGAYVCQSQSLNIFMEEPTFAKLTNMHFYAWERGLKTGSYYLRTRPRAKAAAMTLDPTLPKRDAACRLDDPTCEACGA